MQCILNTAFVDLCPVCVFLLEVVLSNLLGYLTSGVVPLLRSGCKNPINNIIKSTYSRFIQVQLLLKNQSGLKPIMLKRFPFLQVNITIKFTEALEDLQGFLFLRINKTRFNRQFLIKYS